ncbi:DUF881 domain-containing protein [Nocardioides sp. dk4132]|uniref:DUF881 domain-containing protein n=1 Tax=unclassified Nocardioides TaxID=2615069 RepID=UPI00129621FC|nr:MULTISPECIES: DUF881 domain-containing protein [unclassified Nocardioides]MQW75237.1 DUF881 domain-containing protein [Nocardioides sp. dk4132]QGA07610.1 DUF881 domain-containing protein [Nocardioides sp. dk884]
MPERPQPAEPAGAPSRPAPPPAQEEGPPSGRQRLRSALVRPSRAQTVVAILLALLAFATVTQVRQNEVEDSFAGYREQDLIDVLNGLSSTSQRAEAEIERLEETRAELLSDTTSRTTALEQAQQESETLAILAGLVPVTGPGLRITISEDDGSVRASDLVDMVQELRTAGAEAMQVNGQVRLVAQSYFADAPGGMSIDNEVVTAPYVFDVIGDPDNLTNALTFYDGPRDNVERSGGSMTIEERSSLDIEAVRRPVEPEYAQPAPEQ